jgi:hypothetical protein
MEMYPTPEEAKHLLGFLPSRPDYEDWIKIVSAIGNTFDEATALKILLSRFQDEKKGEHISKLRGRLKQYNYGTLVYIAKQYGYIPQNKPYNAPCTPFNARDMVNYSPKIEPYQSVKMLSKPFYRFINEVIEERAGIMEYDGGLSRSEAENKVLELYPEAEKERLYCAAINLRVINKNLDPVTMKPKKDYYDFTFGLENQYMTVSEIIEAIGKGFSYCCGHFKAEQDGTIARKSENWLYSDIIGIDIDSGLTIEQALKIPEMKHAFLLHTSASHTPAKNRFRILIDIAKPIIDTEQYKKLMAYFIKVFGADQNCKDTGRAFFGNNNATFINITTGETIQYRNGKVYDNR